MTSTLHATSGTARRSAHVLSGNGLIFRLDGEIREAREDLRHSTGGRSGKTLAKAAGLRVTLVVLEPGVTLEPEAAAGGASLHVLEGRVAVQADGGEQELGPGDLVVFGSNLRQPVRALERSAFLITVAWPEGAGAWDQEARTGHLGASGPASPGGRYRVLRMELLTGEDRRDARTEPAAGLPSSAAGPEMQAARSFEGQTVDLAQLEGMGRLQWEDSRRARLDTASESYRVTLERVDR